MTVTVGRPGRAAFFRRKCCELAPLVRGELSGGREGRHSSGESVANLLPSSEGVLRVRRESWVHFNDPLRITSRGKGGGNIEIPSTYLAAASQS